jgi:hypothetical protein
MVLGSEKEMNPRRLRFWTWANGKTALSFTDMRKTMEGTGFRVKNKDAFLNMLAF